MHTVHVHTLGVSISPAVFFAGTGVELVPSVFGI